MGLLLSGRMVEKTRMVILATFLGIAVSSCGFSENKEAAEAVANQMFEELSTGLTEAYFDLYSNDFYGLTSRGEWQSIRQRTHAITGGYRGHELIDWSASSTIQTGSRVVLTYRVTYESRVAIEMLTFQISDGAQIIGHHQRPDQ